MQGRWAGWWVWIWGVVAVALLVLVFLLPFRWWAVATLVGFGTMEAIGLLRPEDAYPPLTQVIKRYVPRSIAFTAIYGFTGAAGAVWIPLGHPARWALFFAVLGWLTTHFDVTFDDDTTRVERGKWRRIKRPLTSVLTKKDSGPPQTQSGEQVSASP